MNSGKNTPRYLGAAFLAVAVLSITASLLSVMTLLSGSITESLEYTAAGAPEASIYQILGSLFFGIDRWGYDIHFLFFCLGAILWYSLFYRSRYIPHFLSIWGILAVILATMVIVLAWFDVTLPIFFFLPNMLFELTIGVWLMVKGIPSFEPVE